MKTLLFVLFVATSAVAQKPVTNEVITFTTRAGKEYHEVTLSRVTEKGLVVMYPKGGGGTVAFDDLPDWLSARFQPPKAPIRIGDVINFTNRKGESFSNAVVKRVMPEGFFFAIREGNETPSKLPIQPPPRAFWPLGGDKLLFSDVTDELASRFGFNPVKAKSALDAIRIQEGLYELNKIREELEQTSDPSQAMIVEGESIDEHKRKVEKWSQAVTTKYRRIRTEIDELTELQKNYLDAETESQIAALELARAQALGDPTRFRQSALEAALAKEEIAFRKLDSGLNRQSGFIPVK